MPIAIVIAVVCAIMPGPLAADEWSTGGTVQKSLLRTCCDSTTQTNPVSVHNRRSFWGFNYLSVSSESSNIAYVLIRGDGNFWLADNLSGGSGTSFTRSEESSEVAILGQTDTSSWFFDFESGIGHEGEAIPSGVPDFQFTTTDGNDWVYADITTDNYNVVSDTCGVHGGGTFSVKGCVFAWLGASGDLGRVDFLNGDGSWLRLGYSTSSTVYLTAYDQFGNLVDSTQGTSDLEACATVGGQSHGVEVRHLFRIYQNAITPQAQHLNFTVSQKEPWIYINGWYIELEPCFANMVSFGDDHHVNVNASEGSISFGQSVDILVTLYLTAWNTLRISGVHWDEMKSIKACPDFGWVIEDPIFGSGDTIMHRLTIHNDDDQETLLLRDIKLLLSDEFIGDISGLSEFSDSLEDVILGPGDSLAYDVIEECMVGDANRDKETDIDDVVYLINYIFAGGPTPEPVGAGDADCSGGVDIDDVVYLINYIFAGGPVPGQTCNCGSGDQKQRVSAHIYGTFKIEDSRGDIVAENWFDHPVE